MRKLPFWRDCLSGWRLFLREKNYCQQTQNSCGSLKNAIYWHGGGRGLSVDRIPDDMRRMLGGISAHGTKGSRPRKEAVYLPFDDGEFGVFLEILPTTPDAGAFTGSHSSFVVTALDSRKSHEIDAEAIAKYFPLSPSEKSVLEMVVRGNTNSEIAQERGRTVETVNSQLKALLRKLGSRNRTELVRVAVSLSSSALYPDLPY